MNTPSLIVFDLDDTLYPYSICNDFASKALSDALVLRLGISPTEAENELRLSRQIVKKRLGKTASSHSRLLYIQETLARGQFANQADLALELEHIFWRSYISKMAIRPGAEELLNLARYNDIPLALVTDLTLQIQLRKLQHLEFEHVFDVIVASEEVGHDKSSLEPFHLLKERASDVWMSDVWFVGDSEYDGPVEELINQGVIDEGHFWHLNGESKLHTTGITNLDEVTEALKP